MSKTSIKERISILKGKICSIQDQIEELRELCPHANSNWIGRPWSGMHYCKDCGAEYKVSEEQVVRDLLESGNENEEAKSTDK